MRPASLSIAVVSDDETLSRRVVALLEQDGKVVRADGSGDDVSVLDTLDSNPDIVLVRRSVKRPGLEHLLRAARRRLPRTRRIAVLPAPAQIEVGRLLAAGADGLIAEIQLESTFAVVADAVMAGYVCVPAPMRHALDPPALSYRERQILALAVAGYSNAEIAQRLVISQSTVKSHLGSAYRQLGVRSRREAMSVVLATGDLLRRGLLATLDRREEDR